MSEAENSLLQKGLGFAISQKKIPESELKVACEDFARKLVVRSLHPLKPATAPEATTAKPPFKPNNFYFPENANPKLQTCLHEFGFKVIQILRSAKPPPSNLTKPELQALKTLRQDESVLILPADKGNSTVMISRLDYVSKMATILDDPAHFRRIETNPTQKWEKKLNRFLFKGLFKTDLIEKRLYKFLRASDARTPQLYGLPKIHKKGVPLRPIVSAVRSFNYNTGKFLVWCLNPYMTSCDSYVRNSVDFADSLSKVKPGYSRQVSFDVKSLFTNVPVKEAVDLAMEIILKDEDARFPLPANKLKQLFEFATSHCCFQFQEDFFLQIDGLSMGNPLAPLSLTSSCFEWKNGP